MDFLLLVLATPTMKAPCISLLSPKNADFPLDFCSVPAVGAPAVWSEPELPPTSGFGAVGLAKVNESSGVPFASA